MTPGPCGTRWRTRTASGWAPAAPERNRGNPPHITGSDLLFAQSPDTSEPDRGDRHGTRSELLGGPAGVRHRRHRLPRPAPGAAAARPAGAGARAGPAAAAGPPAAAR